MGIPADVTQTPPASDQANAVVEGSFTGTGQSDSLLVWGPFNVNLGGDGGPNGSWDASVQLERSFDGGTSWYVRCDSAGVQLVFSTNDKDVSFVVVEPEQGMLYRLNCTTYTSGTINYRLSTTGGAATTWRP
jgi:hypothetical protein